MTLELYFQRRISTLETLESVLEELAGGAEDLIDLGLERVTAIASRLCLDRTDAKVLTVAGTNGKGSVVAFSEAILVKLGVNVGTYTSPHLQKFNERIRVNGEAVSDAEILEALEAIRDVLGEIALTYFEIATIAALYIFNAHRLDILVLEVGLGGRLDAVNILDPDVSLITSIDIDHTEWLGDDREVIGKEKAGILRPGCPAIIADPNPPKSIKEQSPTSHFFYYKREWNVSEDDQDSAFMRVFVQNSKHIEKTYRFTAPKGILAANVGASVQALTLLNFDISEAQLSEIADEFLLVGRLQRFLLDGREILIDVAHNPSAVSILKEHIESNEVIGRNYVIFAALKDKDIHGMLKCLSGIFTAWFVADLPEATRRADSNDVLKILSELGEEKTTTWPTVSDAWNSAWNLMVPGDRLVIFGSFYTISSVLSLIQVKRDGPASE